MENCYYVIELLQFQLLDSELQRTTITKGTFALSYQATIKHQNTNTNNSHGILKESKTVLRQTTPLDKSSGHQLQKQSSSFKPKQKFEQPSAQKVIVEREDTLEGDISGQIEDEEKPNFLAI